MYVSVSVCDDRDAHEGRERGTHRDRYRVRARTAAGQRLPKIIPSAAGKTQFPGQNLMIGHPARQKLIGFPGAAKRTSRVVLPLAKIAVPEKQLAIEYDADF